MEKQIINTIEQYKKTRAARNEASLRNDLQMVDTLNTELVYWSVKLSALGIEKI